jgi:SAM-dependent methyltransferase
MIWQAVAEKRGRDMDDEELAAWFAATKTLLETAYLAGEQPWRQSGFGLHTPRTYAAWEAHRKPIADCIERSGSFLDIGCANGYPLECVLRWTAERGVTIEPYGLDLAQKFVALAQRLLPAYAGHFFVGNAWDWTPPRPFDYVRTELVYVPDALRAAYISRLLVAGYRGRGAAMQEVFVDDRLLQLGFVIEDIKSGVWEGEEKTRIAVIGKAG